jgi:hypothetical protein
LLIAVNKEELEAFIESQISCWEEIGGGANYEAYEFNPKKVDKQQLVDLGFYENRDSWIAGAQIKKLQEYLIEIKQTSGIRI